MDPDLPYMPFRVCGRTGLRLPAISLVLGDMGGEDFPFATAREVLRRAFELGITHFDFVSRAPRDLSLDVFGRLYTRDFMRHRAELIISMGAGSRTWPGPYGVGGSRKHLLGALDRCLKVARIDYLDLFYSQWLGDETPVEETVGALVAAVAMGKARYIGISSYPPDQALGAMRLSREFGTPLAVHRDCWTMLRTCTPGVPLDVLHAEGVGAVVTFPRFQRPLAENCVPRQRQCGATRPSLGGGASNWYGPDIDSIARHRGQTVSQLLIAWALHDPRVTTAAICPATVDQVYEAVASLLRLGFDASEWIEIDRWLTARGATC